MTLMEYSKEIETNNSESIILVKYGNFYRCFNEDALIAFYLFNYKISDNYRTGFPLNTLTKVLVKLKDAGISCIVINGIGNYISYDSFNNKYLHFLELAKNHYNYVIGVNIIMEEVKECLSKSLNNIGKIKDY